MKSFDLASFFHNKEISVIKTLVELQRIMKE